MHMHEVAPVEGRVVLFKSPQDPLGSTTALISKRRIFSSQSGYAEGEGSMAISFTHQYLQLGR